MDFDQPAAGLVDERSKVHGPPWSLDAREDTVGAQGRISDMMYIMCLATCQLMIALPGTMSNVLRNHHGL